MTIITDNLTIKDEKRINKILIEFRSFCRCSRYCNYSLKLEALVVNLIKVFLDTKLEDGIGFFEASAIDNYYSRDNDECRVMRRLDEHYYWENIYFNSHQPEDTDWHKHFYPMSAISFMDAQGVKFILPCCLLWALEYYDYEDNAKDIPYVSRVVLIAKHLLNSEQKLYVLEVLNILKDRAFEWNEDYEYDELENAINKLS